VDKIDNDPKLSEEQKNAALHQLAYDIENLSPQLRQAALNEMNHVMTVDQMAASTLALLGSSTALFGFLGFSGNGTGQTPTNINANGPVVARRPEDGVVNSESDVSQIIKDLDYSENMHTEIAGNAPAIKRYGVTDSDFQTKLKLSEKYLNDNEKQLLNNYDKNLKSYSDVLTKTLDLKGLLLDRSNVEKLLKERDLPKETIVFLNSLLTISTRCNYL